MFRTTRRTFFLSAAAAAASVALDQRAAVARHKRSRHKTRHTTAPQVVRAPHVPDPVHGFHRYKVGDATCTALYLSLIHI